MILAVLLVLSTTDPVPSGYTCDDVRRLIAEREKVAALAFAVEHGLSVRQIWQIRRTCKV
ncbi:hypothetical protein ACE102_33645 [Bradyrhizobium sp. vgs-9]|uniref:hypothetical protein n=1 Tax=Bradyrhizobium sp. vgs-9 TaxID=208389 RepID=UPI0035D41808